jgi:hypothetical protein
MIPFQVSGNHQCPSMGATEEGDSVIGGSYQEISAASIRPRSDSRANARGCDSDGDSPTSFGKKRGNRRVFRIDVDAGL